MSCKNCGGDMIGDGHTTPIRCERVETPADHEPDADPIYCEEYPCHLLPKEEWCDHSGAGGFMGHTCIQPKPKPKPKPVKVTAFELKLALLEYYRFGSQCVTVDEFNGADVIADTGKEIIEIEVKVDKGDLRRGELKKQRKHALYNQGSGFAQCHPNKFMFCVPTELIEVAREVVAELNPKYGIITFDTDQFQRVIEAGHVPYTRKCLCVIKRAGRLHTNYAPQMQRLIAKRASTKLITLMQKQQEKKIHDYRSTL